MGGGEIMKYRALGSSGLSVSEVCLGSMTWGQQNTQQDADAQIDYALSRGVNFIDTAEMYPIPQKPETYGATERIIGDWLSRNTEKRKDLVLATKIVGKGLHWIREGAGISGAAVVESVDQSLKRLQTDYIDLFQLHWPNRPFPHFGQHWANHLRFSNADAKHETEQMHEILDALNTCIQAGKIRYAGLSDETCWGINTYLRLSEKFSLPRIVSIQNEFNLIHTKDWPYLIENCVMENIAYLPWSPLAAGSLTGKYINGARPEGARWSLRQRLGLFRDTEIANEAITAYKSLAESFGISAASLALAWCRQVDGVTSTIIGATTMDQLVENLDAFQMELSADQLSGVAEVMKRYPVPF